MRLEQVVSELQQQQDELQQHRVFAQIKTIEYLQVFMQWHVFAVWDFMSLVKRLQRDLTSMELPWMPPSSPRAARLINEIVLAEESDEAPAGGHLSHFELYRQAMREVQADTSTIDCFIERVHAGNSIDQALRVCEAPQPVQDFTSQTVHIAREASLFEVLGYFLFGREHVIPGMFQRLLDQWQIDTNSAPTFVYYLQRHIELDGDSHGPAAMAMIRDLTGDSTHAMQRVRQAALDAIQQRMQLWGALSKTFSANHHVQLDRTA